MRPRIERAGGDDPFDRVFQLGATDRRRALALALAAALLAHASMAGALRLRGERLEMQATPLGAQELSIEREVPPPPPPPEPEPEPPPPPPPDPMHWTPSVAALAPNPSENPDEQPASAAAQAGEVLTQDEDQEEEETDDEDENTFVTGDGGAYAGGLTMSNGTSTAPVSGSIVIDGGVPGGSGTVAATPPKPKVRDLSRGAWLDGSTSWDDCDFPGEAERDNIRDAVVEITVTVRPNGTAEGVKVVEDPGHGFARTASACALKHTYAPALDPQGNKIWGTTRPFHVGFHR